MVKDPKVYCPKENREVPVWWCIGSFWKRRKRCPDLFVATIKIAENYTEVKCRASELEIMKSMTRMSIESLQDTIEEEPDLYSGKDIKTRFQKEEE